MHAQFIDGVAALPKDVDRAAAMVDLVWQLVIDHTFAAWLELVMAARTDADLAPKVADLESRFVSRMAVTAPRCRGHGRTRLSPALRAADEHRQQGRARR
jgi:hypothetical protein